jgi:hypothetical protein
MKLDKVFPGENSIASFKRGATRYLLNGSPRVRSVSGVSICLCYPFGDNA